MPTSRQLPSWIRPADPLRYFLPAFQAASAAAQARARLQQAAQQAGVEAGLRSRQIDEQAALRKQEMAVESQDRQIRLELEARRLEETERKNAADAKWAWEKYQDTRQNRELQREFQQQQQARSFAHQEKMRTLIPEPEIRTATVKGEQVPYLVSGESRHAAWFPGGLGGASKRNELTTLQKTNLRDKYQKEIDTLIQANPDLNKTKPDESWATKTPYKLSRWKAGRDAIDRKQKQIDALDEPITTSGTSTNFADAPKDPSKREMDVTYKVGKRLFTWKGKGWLPYDQSLPDDEPDEEEE